MKREVEKKWSEEKEKEKGTLGGGGKREVRGEGAGGKGNKEEDCHGEVYKEEPKKIIGGNE